MATVAPPPAPPASAAPMKLSDLSSPARTRPEAKAMFDLLTTGGDDPSSIFHSVKGDGVTFMSDVPASTLGGVNVVLGIDEAGRGSVLGPMTYSAAYWAVSKAEEMEVKGFDDSKALTTETRRKLFDKIQATEDVGYVIRVLQASEISRNMLRKTPYNLNEMR